MVIQDRYKCSKRLPCHADIYSMRQHMKIGQQASCLMYRMMMMMMMMMCIASVLELSVS